MYMCGGPILSSHGAAEQQPVGRAAEAERSGFELHGMTSINKRNDPYNQYYWSSGLLEEAYKMQLAAVSRQSLKGSAPQDQAAPISTAGWSKDQVLRAQAQVLMLRLLSRDAPIPAHVVRAAQGVHDIGERALQQELKDNCTSLAMVDHGYYKSPDLRVLNAQRDFVVSQRIRRRKVELAEIMPSLPARLNFQAELELHQLNVLESQRAVRRELLNCNPLLSLPTLDSLKFYQQDRALGLNSTLQSEEEWKERKKAAQERALREAHEQHLASLKLHHEAFGKWMATVKEMRRKLCLDVKRYFVEKEREVIRQEQRRLQALRSGDMAKYREFLKEMKNQKLQDILDRTDKFLEKLGAKVHAGQEAHKQETAAAASAAVDTDSAIGDSERYKLQYKIVEKVETQPSILGGPMGFQLKGYQLIGLQWMVNLYNKRLSGILADEMGLGKTIQVVALVSYLVEIKQNNGPFLIIVPLSTMENWRLEFERWCPSLVVYTYQGNPEERVEFYKTKLREGKFHVLIVSYQLVCRKKVDLPNLRRIEWKYMVIDEGHRLKNRDCKLFIALTEHFSPPHKLILTGTPLQNDVGELWALLNFLMPHIFDTSEEFESWFRTPFETPSDEASQIDTEARELIIKQLHQVLRPFMLRRMKNEVLDQLPDAKEAILRAPMSALQIMMYCSFMNRVSMKNMTGMNFNNPLMQMRKVCNHPFLFDALNLPGYSAVVRVCGKFELLDRVLYKLRATGHRVLIYSQMVELLRLLEDFCMQRNYTYFKLDGSTAQEERARMMAEFNAPNSPAFLFLLSTRAGGQGINLQTADTVLLFDNDWNPMMDEQAKARVHRIGQKSDVLMVRFYTPNTVEERILLAAQRKLQVDDLAIESGLFNLEATEQESHEALRSKLRNASDDDGIQGFSNEEVNERIARTNEEITIFESIDERWGEIHQKRWEEQGHRGPAPEPIMDADEIPEEFLHAVPSVGATCRVMTPPTAVLSALPLPGTVKKHIKSRDGKVTHLKVLLDLGDEITVERYMVVPPAPKIIGTGAGAFEETQVLENQRNRTAVSRTQNISHANMSDRAFERMCETGEVPDLDRNSRLKKRKASKEDSSTKGKKSVVVEDDDDDEDDEEEEEEEEEDAPKSDRKSRHSGKNDVKTPSKVKSSASKRSLESNGDGDSDGDDEPMETRHTPNSSNRRSRGR